MACTMIMGATSGIGRFLAERYIAAGDVVGICGRRTALLEDIRNTAPDRVHAATVDIDDADGLAARLDELAGRMGGMDRLVVSSGTGDINKTLDLQVERRTIATNVLGFTAAIDWGYAYFARQGRGHLVGITSVAALTGGNGCPAYNASKAYQANYLAGVRATARAAKLDIAVTDIRPGFVDTAMAKGEGLFWVAPVEKAGRQIFKAIQAKRSVAYVTRRWGLLARVAKPFLSFL